MDIAYLEPKNLEELRQIAGIRGQAEILLFPVAVTGGDIENFVGGRAVLARHTGGHPKIVTSCTCNGPQPVCRAEVECSQSTRRGLPDAGQSF